MRKNQTGQMLVMYAVALAVILVITGIVVDGGLMALSWWTLQEDADSACLAGATGGDANLALANAGQPSGTLTWTNRTLYLDVSKSEPVYFLQLVGFDQLAFDVRTRCLIPEAAFLPIAVKRPWLDEGLIDPDLTYGILGQEADQCDLCSGADFSGAVIPNIICVDGVECEVRAFLGIEEGPSPNIYKSEIEDLIRSSIRANVAGIGTRVPQISGVSNKFLVKAVADTYAEGDHLIVIIFDGEIAGPNPWENLEVVSYAEVVITDLSDPNTLWVNFVREIDNLEGVNLATRTRTISWSWSGG